jgi:hypothetical protein
VTSLVIPAGAVHVPVVEASPAKLTSRSFVVVAVADGTNTVVAFSAPALDDTSTGVRRYLSPVAHSMPRMVTTR